MLVALEGTCPAPPGGVDADPLVTPEENELRRPVDVGAVVQVLLAQHREGRLTGFRVRNLCQLVRQEVGVAPIADGAGRLAEVDLPARGEAVGAGGAEVDVGEKPILSGARQERQAVECPGVALLRPGEALVDLGQVVEPPALERLERAAPEAEVACLLEPAVEMEHPVDRLHAVVGEEEDGRLLPVALAGCLDQLPARGIDALVHPDDLVAGMSRVMSRVVRIDARVAEVADVVRAHEVDAEKRKIRLELECEPAHARNLVDVVKQEVRVRGKVLPPTLRHRMVRRDEVGILGEDAPARSGRNDLGLFGAAVAGDDDALDGLGRVGERDTDEGRPEAACRKQLPERCPRSARCALDPLAPPVRVRGEVEDAVPRRVEAGQKRRPGRRREGRKGRAKGSVGPFAGEPGEGRQPPLRHQGARQLVVRAVETKRQDSHAARTSS